MFDRLLLWVWQTLNCLSNKKKKKKKRRVGFSNNIEIVREWELLIMGERKEEEKAIVPKNIQEYTKKYNKYRDFSIVRKLYF